MKIKKINFKDIDFKDKKFIFPLIIVLCVLFIAWFVIGAIRDVSAKDDESGKEDATEIQLLPMSENQNIVTKPEAMSEEIKSQDYTALRSFQDLSLVESDSTIYTDAEIAMLDSLERESQKALEEIKKQNEIISSQNQNLFSDMSTSPDISSYSSSSGSLTNRRTEEKSITEEMMLYQKLLNGEEILTPEEEKKRETERIRQEERQRIMDEMSKSETYKVEKTTNINPQAFNTLSSSLSQKTEQDKLIKAMIDETTQVSSGSRIRIKLLEDINLNGEIIRKNSHIYGIISGFADQRVMAQVTSIILSNGKHCKVKLSVLDTDGQLGFYVPKSAFSQALKQAASQTVQSNNMGINTSENSNSFASLAVQTIQQAYQAIGQVASSNIQKEKATIKYNTIVYLTNQDK